VARFGERWPQGQPGGPADDELLQTYHWPGNIRELQNVIERSVILAEGGTLRIDRPCSVSVSCPKRLRTGTF